MTPTDIQADEVLCDQLNKGFTYDQADMVL
jgi:hypothetical protein